MLERDNFERELEQYLEVKEESSFDYPLPMISEKDLQKADILLSTTNEKLSKLIRTSTKSTVSHSGFYIGNGLVAEAISEPEPEWLKTIWTKLKAGDLPTQLPIYNGVTIRNLSEKINSSDIFILVLRYKGLSPVNQDSIIGYVYDQSQYRQKKKYGFDAIKFLYTKSVKGDSKTFYCSELISKAFNHAGVPLPTITTSQITPADINRLGQQNQLEQIGFLKKTGKKLEYYKELESNVEQFEDMEYFNNEFVAGTEIDFSDVPYLKGISPSLITRLKRWASNLISSYTLAKQNKGVILEQLLKKFPSLLQYEGPLVIIYFLYHLIKLEVSFIKLYMEHKNFDVQLASLRGICYAIVARKQKVSEPLPLPPKTWDNKLTRAYNEGAEYIETLYKQGKDITPFDGIEDIPKITAVNMLWSLFGKFLFYDQLDHSRWNKFKDLYGSKGLTWPVDNNILDYEFEILKNNTMEKNYYELNDELDNEYEDYEEDEYEDYEEDEYEDYEEDEYDDDETAERYGERLEEIANESLGEYELDAELDNELDEMENQYFVKRLDRKRKRSRRKGKKGKGLFAKILKAGANIAGKVPLVGDVIRAGTSLARGDMNGMVKGLAKAATFIPIPGVGPVASAAFDVVAGSGDEGEIRRNKRKRSRLIANITRDAYKELADNFPYEFEDREVVHEAAKNAIRRAMAKNGVRPQKPMQRKEQSPERRKEKDSSDKGEGRRTIRLNPGEQVLIIRPRNKQ